MKDDKIFTEEDEFYIKAGIKTIASSRFGDFNVDVDKFYNSFVWWISGQNPMLQIGYLASAERLIKRRMNEKPDLYSNRLDTLGLTFGRDAYLLGVASKIDIFCILDEYGQFYFDRVNLSTASEDKVEQLYQSVKHLLDNELDEDEEELPNIEDDYDL